jgi:quinol monooxygenase YgiN
MVGGLKRLQVQAGREREFERLFKELNQETHHHEKGCTVYTLMRSRARPGVYMVHEQYADQAALAAHQTSAYATRYFPQIRALLDAYEGEYFDIVVD